MKAKTLQIVWHSKDPVFTLDFHPDGHLATGGGDKDIKIWELQRDADGSPHVQYVASLAGHSRTVNCVRFSRTGHCLASAGDGGELLIWRPAPNAAGSTLGLAAATPLSASKARPAAPTAATAMTTPAAAARPESGGSGGSPPQGQTASLAAAAASTAAAAAGAGVDEPANPLAGAAAAAWKLSATLRGHHDDVTDIAWAHDDAVLMSGSVENEVMMFDVDSRRTLARLEGHRHYVQGVAWDPLGAWMVSQSADRTVRVHGLKPPPNTSKAAAASAAPKSSAQLAKDVLHLHTLARVALQPALPAAQPQAGQHGQSPAAAADAAAAAPPADGGADTSPAPDQLVAGGTAAAAAAAATKPLQAALFADESLNTFFRRLAWSPDGSLLAVPAGLYRGAAGQPPRATTYLFARGQWGAPLASLPCPGKASTAVRFCPLLFALRPGGAAGQQQQQQPEAAVASADAGAAAGEGVAAAGAEHSPSSTCALGLPYRMVLAVATMDSVLLCDTQTLEPFVLVGPLHFAPITDVAWARDGSALAVSSHDGYCSIVTFQPGELGEPITDAAALPDGLAAALSKVADAAAATATKAIGSGGAAPAAGAAGGGLVSVSPRPAAAAAAAAPAAAAGGALQQQQQPGGKPRIQPQRIEPQPVRAAAAPHAGGGSAFGGGGAARRITPQPVPSTAPATAPTTAPAPTASAGAAPAAKPRRLTPQAVTADGAPLAAPPASASRVGLAAVQAARAAAAARKRAAEAAAAAAGAGAGNEEGSKKAKL